MGIKGERIRCFFCFCMRREWEAGIEEEGEEDAA